MLKMALLDCAINEKCYSVDEGRAFAVSFRPHPGGFDAKCSSRVPVPGIIRTKPNTILTIFDINYF